MSAIEFENPVVAGTTLIREAIISPDYVPGVSGWAIFADGTAEFNDATMRGAIEAGGGTVLLDSGGVYVRNSERQYDINGVGGFLARNYPDDGAYAQLTVYSAPDSAGGVIAMRQKNAATPGVTFAAMLFYVDTNPDEQPVASWFGPGITAPSTGHRARISLYGGSLTDNESKVKMTADVVETTEALRVGRYWSTVSDPGDSALIGVTETAVLTVPATTYIAGRTYRVTVQGRFKVDTTTTDPIWRLRKTNAAGALLCLWGRTGTGKASQENALNLQQHFTVGASDVTASLALCVVGSAATNVQMMGTFGGRSITVEDVSDDFYFPHANVLT